MHLVNNKNMMLKVCVCFAGVLEPDAGLEHHRRSSSMRVTGTSYRSIARERSSDDCIIGTHLGMGTLHLTTPRSRIYRSLEENDNNLINQLLVQYCCFFGFGISGHIRKIWLEAVNELPSAVTVLLIFLERGI